MNYYFWLTDYSKDNEACHWAVIRVAFSTWIGSSIWQLYIGNGESRLVVIMIIWQILQWCSRSGLTTRDSRIDSVETAWCCCCTGCEAVKVPVGCDINLTIVTVNGCISTGKYHLISTVNGYCYKSYKQTTATSNDDRDNDDLNLKAKTWLLLSTQPTWKNVYAKCNSIGLLLQSKYTPETVQVQ